MSFSSEFIWGSATASYQIEGGAYQDQKGLSIWDMFCKWDSKIFNGNTGDCACDSYNNLETDIKILKESGHKAYRFSISWTRILPEGIGEVNMQGIRYYRRLIQALLDNNITPYVTLFHWDYPYALYKKGGWLNRESVKWFEYYTSVVLKYLGDLVNHWITLNEPQIFVGQGHYLGVHAPGLKLNKYDLITIVHHVLLAHGTCVRTIKNRYPNAKVGFAPTGPVGIPLSENESDIESARKTMFDEHLIDHVSDNFPIFSYALYCDPVFLGKYPDWVHKELSMVMPDTITEDLKIISTEIDFLGTNIYNGSTWTIDKSGQPLFVEKSNGYAMTAFNWPVTPKALYYGPKFLYERYNKPLYITENGMSQRDWISEDGKIYDYARIDFMKQYLRELNRAVSDGVEVLGYFCWSLMDNFEWAEGYKERFGLVYVDFKTKIRTPKESYYWYRDIIQNNGSNL